MTDERLGGFIFTFYFTFAYFLCSDKPALIKSSHRVTAGLYLLSRCKGQSTNPLLGDADITARAA